MSENLQSAPFDDLVGKTLTHIITKQAGRDGDGDIIEVYFKSDTDNYKMHHYQDCCESVYLAEIIGDLNDLVGDPILQAECVTQEGQSMDGTATWTFYKLATIKGSVTLRWLGESNGYYSEDVSFEKFV